ncbi:MAG: OstA-like protein [Bacteroidota bacterium]
MLIATQCEAQQKTRKIDLVNADNAMYDKSKGEFTRLIGNVIFQHEETLMYCDSAYLYDESNSLIALGKVHIKVNDSINIYSDSLHYDGNTKIAELHRNVKLIDNQITLTTEHLTYNMRDKLGRYYDGGKIVDPDNTLTSVIGFYYSEKKDFFFNDSVVLVNVNYTMHSDSLMYNTKSEISHFFGPTTMTSEENFIYCEKGWYDTKKDASEFTKNAWMRNDKQKMSGDSILYNRITGVGLAYHNVTITDTSRSSIIKGNFIRYDQKHEYSLATDSALLMQYDKGDTLYLHADTLLATFDTATRKAKTIYAFHKVKFWRTDLQGMADSLVYRYSDSTINLFYNPVLWTEDKQLKADTIVIHLANNLVRMIDLFSAAFVITCDDSTAGRYNQVKSLNMKGFFNEGELYKIEAYTNAETIYYLREDNGKRIGTNKAVSRNLAIYINNNEIKTISFLDKPEATLYPDKDVKGDDLYLKDFIWLDKKRPKTKFAVYTWN